MSRGGLLLASLLGASLAAGWGCSLPPSPARIRSWEAEIAALQAEQDSLRRRAAELAAADPRMQALPQGDVVLGVPTAFLRNVVDRVFADVADRATLRLSGIRAHVAKQVKKIIPIGEFVVDVEIHEVIGNLEPGQPTLAFGDDAATMSLPIELASGHGDATIHFVWNGKNIADLVCGDMDVSQRVSGTVIPGRYVIDGRMTLSARGSRVVCTPVFPETKVNIRVKPSKASWAAIDSILAEKHGVCGWVLDKVDVPSLLTELVEVKGFDVRLPLDKVRPFLLPGGVTDTMRVGDRSIAVATRLRTLRIDPEAVWYSADVHLASP